MEGRNMSKEKPIRKMWKRIILLVIIIFVVLLVLLLTSIEIGLHRLMKREKDYLGPYIVAEDRELGRYLADLGSSLYSSEWEVSEEQWETLLQKLTEDGWYQRTEGDERLFTRVKDVSHLLIPFVCEEDLRMSVKRRISDGDTKDVIILKISIFIETKTRRSRHK